MLDRMFLKHQATSVPPAFVTSSGVSNSTSLSIPTHQSGDWIVLVNANQTDTPPSLTSGFTNITTFSTNAGATRSARAQYCISDGAITSVPIEYYGHVAILRNVSAIGAINQLSSNETTSALLVSLTGVASGSLCLFAAYVGTAVSGATGLTVAPSFGGYETVAAGETTAGGTISYSLIGKAYFGAEFL